MLIECILKREGGTKVQLDDIVYHFKPTEIDPRHLSEVLNRAHAQRFLAISEGYVFAGEGPAPTSDKPQRQAQQGMPRTSITHPASFEIGGRTFSLPELTIIALRESGLTVAEWNEQDDEDLYEQLDTALQELRTAAEEAQEQRELREAPERGAIPQPEPEQGLQDDDEEEEDQTGPAKTLGSDLPTDDENSGADTGASTGPAAGGTDSATGTTGTDSTADAGAGSKPKEGIPDRAELERQYKERQGRLPSKKLSDERIWQLLNEAD